MRACRIIRFHVGGVAAIDKRRICSYAGKLTSEQMEQIDAALRVSLRLDEDAYLPTEVEAP